MNHQVVQVQAVIFRLVGEFQNGQSSVDELAEVAYREKLDILLPFEILGGSFEKQNMMERFWRFISLIRLYMRQMEKR